MDFVDALLEPGHNRPGTPLSPSGIVLHSTATLGATAVQIRDYFNNTPRAQASAHICVDWTQAITMIPWQPGKAEIAWHAGPTANHLFLGIEWSETNDSDLFAEGYANYVAAVRTILDLYGWPVDEGHVWSHERISYTFHETTHVDPIPYLTEHKKTWDQLVADIAAAPTVVSPEASADETPTAEDVIREGATGLRVGEIQALLRAKGFDLGPVDGIFGPQTTLAVMAFQRANNLIVDGIVGPQTLAKLRA